MYCMMGSNQVHPYNEFKNVNVFLYLYVYHSFSGKSMSVFLAKFFCHMFQINIFISQSEGVGGAFHGTFY